MIIRKTHPIIKILNNSLYDFPSPSNINYLWNFGSLLGICLSIQTLTGIFLSFHYSNDILLSFFSLAHITHDVNMGWLLRNLHANGATFFFILIYCHIGRNLFFSSFFFIMAWFSGIIILLILMATAFLGYVLPWGQMSFWGATVITNLFSAIPYLGQTLTFWIWGGFSINNATLSRFFSLHFILPFIIILLVVIHILFLHETGSSNPLGSAYNIDKIPFHPFFTFKDILGILMFLFLLSFFSLFYPYFFLDPENFSQANPLVTPPHIQPEWYFLFAYAILRSIPNKLGGVIGLFLSITILFFLPLSSNSNNSISLMKKIFFWIFINIFFMLTILGAMPVEHPFVFLSQSFTTLYFLYFFFRMM